MSDRADEIVEQLDDTCTHGDEFENYGPCCACIAVALRAYAEEVRREERRAGAATMTMPTDSLEAAIRAAPCRFCGEPRSFHSPLKGSDAAPDLRICWPFEADPVALAAAARAWMRKQMPIPMHADHGAESWAFNNALDAVARNLGLA